MLSADASLRFAFTDLSGTPVDSLKAADDFILQALIQDTRSNPAPAGFFQAYFDVQYDSALISAHGAVIPGSEYAAFPSGSTTTDGLIDDTGGVDSDILSPDPATAELLLFSVPFRAEASGTLVLSLSAASKSILRFGEPIAVPLSQFQISGNSIEILAAEIRVTPSSGLQTTEAGGTDSFQISLFSAPSANVTIDLLSSNTAEGTVSPSSVTFTPTNWNTPKTVIVTGVDDAQADGNISYHIITQPSVSTDPKYQGVNPPDVSVTNIDNDFVGISVDPTSGQTTEAGGTDTFQIFLNSQPTANVTIGLSSSDTSEGTVSPSSVTFTSANWHTPQTVTVSGVNDFQADGNIAYAIMTAPATSSDSRYNGVNAADVSVTNLDNDSVGVSVEPTTGQTTEAGGTASFQMSLSSQPLANVVIALASSDTTEGTVSPGSVTFTSANWNLPQTVTVTGQDDDLADGNMAYTIQTSAASSTDPAYSGRAVADVSMTNLDNDAVGISVLPSSGQTSESGGLATFTIVLTSRPAADVSIALSSSDTGEGTVAPGGVTFTPATWNTPRTITVTGQDDDEVDGSIAYTIDTAPAVSSDASYNGRNPADVSMTNIDNDTIGITVEPTVGQTTEAGGTAMFSIALNSRPTADVAIGLSSSNTAEGTVSPGSVTFTSTTWNTPQTVTVTGQDDFRVDGNVSYTIVTAPATSNDLSYRDWNAADVALTNLDNDEAGILITLTQPAITSESGQTKSLSVALLSQPTAPVTVNLSSSDTSEGTVQPATLTFTTANWNSSQTVIVTGVNDDDIDGDVQYRVRAEAHSSDPNFDGLQSDELILTNLDNDAPGIRVTPTTGLATSEAGANVSFQVVLQTRPTADVTVGLSSSDLSEGSISADTLTFTPADWSTPRIVTITGVDDHVVDGDIAYSIVTAPAVSSDTHYSGLNPPDVSVTNLDNDRAEIVVAPTSGLRTTEAGGTATFTVVLSSQPAANVALGVSSSDPSEATVSPVGLTFTPANWNVPVTVTVTGQDDLVTDGDVQLDIVTTSASSSDVLYNGLDPANVQVTNEDNDFPGITLSRTSGLTTSEAGGTASFDIVLNTAPTANVILKLMSGNLAEGTVSPTQVTFSPVDWSTPQTVVITGQDDPRVDGNVSYTIVTLPASSADSNYNGIDAVDVAVTNSDDDVADILVTPTTELVTTEAGGAVMFQVRLASEPTADVTIGVTSSDPTEGTVSPGTLTFSSTNWNVSQSITVTGADDFLDDDDVVFMLTTGVTASTDVNYRNLVAESVEIVNLDDDVAAINVSPTSGLATDEQAAQAEFSVVLTSQPAGDVTVPISSSDTGEGTVSPAQLVFTSANWQTPQKVTITGVDDDVFDGNIGYSIVTSPAVSADAKYSGLNSTDVTVVNFDDDTPGIRVTPLTGLVTSEDGGEATFQIRLNTRPTSDVTISVVSSDPGEGTVLPASVTFSPASWNTLQTVTVKGADDSIIDGLVDYSIFVQVTNTDDLNYRDLETTVPVSNHDDDVPGIQITAVDGTGTTESGGTAVLAVALKAQPAANVTVQLASSDETEGQLSMSSLTFTPANWNVPQAVTVRGVDDEVVDGDRAYAMVAIAESSDAHYADLEPVEFMLSNTSNDSATLSLSVDTTQIIEGTGGPNGLLTFTVTLGGTVEGGFRVAYVVNDGTATAARGDYIDNDGFIDFAGTSGEEHSITVEVVPDNAMEPDETFLVALAGLSQISPSAAAEIDVDTSPVTGTILDDDEATISFASVTLPEGSGGGATLFQFDVTLSNPVQGGLRILYTTNDGTATLADGDYVDNDDVLNFAGTEAEVQSILVSVNRDAKVEYDETFVVSLDEIIFLDPALAETVIVEGGSRTGTIVNDDTATITFQAASSAALESAGIHIIQTRLSVTNGGTLSEPVTVDIATLPGGTATTPGDYTLTTTSVTFPAGSADGATRPVEMLLVSDDVVEENESVSFGLTLRGDGMDGRVTVAVPAQHTVVVSEDPMTAGISGRVWFDGNNNGQTDTGESAVPGVTVVLSGTDLRGLPVMIAVMTASDGTYQFDGLPAGTYTVSEIQPKALVDGIDNLGTVDGVASGIRANDEFSNIILAPEQQAIGYDFGERGLANVSASPRFFLASTPLLSSSMREVVALGEERAGDTAKAAEIRRGEAVEVRRLGSRVDFLGTSGADIFTCVPAGNSLAPSASQHLVVANGIRWVFDANEVNTLVVTGSGGSDQLELHDSPGNDLLEASHDLAILSSENLRLEAMAFDLVRAVSTAGGADKVSEDAVDYVLQLEGPWGD